MNNKWAERPGILTAEQAKPILEPYVPGLMDDCGIAFDWVQAILDQDPDRRMTFDTSTVAAMIFNRFVLLWAARLQSDPRVTIRKSGRMMRALIDNRVALRFKKLAKKMNGSLCGGNVRTNAQSLIYYQLGFDGMEDAYPTEITFGYVADPANRSLHGMYLTCPIGWDRNKWAIVLDGEQGTDALPFAAPSDPNQPVEGEAVVVIRSKSKKGASQG
jgi:hypothetical protein